MKKTICFILLCALLLSGCGGEADTKASRFIPSVPGPSETEPATDEQILAYRRDVVEQQMRFMSEVLWTPTEDITYSMVNNSQGLEEDAQTDPSEIVTLYAGRIYKGIPYTHGSGSAYSWLSYATGQDENGVYTLDGIGNQHVNGSSNNAVNRCARLGNDCADQVFWAWAQVSSTITFVGVRTMTEAYGCVKVGDYVFEEDMYTQTTKNVCSLNGEQTIFSCYAQLQKGDALAFINKNNAGHAVMAVSTHPVYNDDGTIDGENSYVVVLEQTSGCERDQEHYFDEELGQEVYLCEIADKEWSYNTLIGKGYLPVTCKELVDPSPLPEVQITDSVENPDAGTLFTGVLESNYRISSVSVEITQNGKVVQQATAFGSQGSMYSYDLIRLVGSVEQTVMLGKLDLWALKEGDYHAKFTCQVSTGEEVVFRELDFSY